MTCKTGRVAARIVLEKGSFWNEGVGGGFGERLFGGRYARRQFRYCTARFVADRAVVELRFVIRGGQGPETRINKMGDRDILPRKICRDYVLVDVMRKDRCKFIRMPRRSETDIAASSARSRPACDTHCRAQGTVAPCDSCYRPYVRGGRRHRDNRVPQPSLESGSRGTNYNPSFCERPCCARTCRGAGLSSPATCCPRRSSRPRRAGPF